MSATAALIPLQSTIVLRGQRAWAHIKTTAAEQRLCWKEIGDALRYGRSLHKADRAFAQWVKEHGFDDMRPGVRSDAMWLAENWEEVYTACNPATSHPSHLRQEHREIQADTPPAPELAIEAPSRLTASIEQVAPQAHRINKLAAMAERGEGQEQKTAQKYLSKKAKEMGMEPEELVTLSRKLDPAAALPPTLAPVLEENIKTLAEIVGELVSFVRSTQEGGPGDTPISKEFAIGLVISTFNRLEA